MSYGGWYLVIFCYVKVVVSVFIIVLIISKMDSSRGVNFDRGNVINWRFVIVIIDFVRFFIIWNSVLRGGYDGVRIIVLVVIVIILFLISGECLVSFFLSIGIDVNFSRYGVGLEMVSRSV